MKNLITLILIATTTLATAQIKLRTDQVDEFTGTVKKFTKYYKVAKGVGQMNMSISRVDSTYFLNMYSVADLGCGGTKDCYITFILEDATKVELKKDYADIDCSDYAISTFFFDPKEFTSPIAKVRFCQNKYYDDAEWGKYTMKSFLDAVE